MERSKNDRRTVFYFLPCISRKVDENTAPGARVDLRRDQGGLQGAGKTFIPLPLWAEDPSVECRVSVQWDISRVSNTTRTIWTFGEGPTPIQVTGKSRKLHLEFSIHGGFRTSYPRQPSKSTSTLGCTGLGLTHPKDNQFGRINEALFSLRAGFFEPDSGTATVSHFHSARCSGA